MLPNPQETEEITADFIFCVVATNCGLPNIHKLLSNYFQDLFRPIVSSIAT